MKLTDKNYYSQEMNLEYCSNSQFKAFQDCEYKAMKMLKGEYVEEPSPALLVGSLLDLYLTENEEAVEKFKAEHPEMYSSRGATKGLLKSEYQRVTQMVECAKSDPKFMYYLSGEHQKIMTGEIFGLKFKIKIDSYLEHKAIVDLKSCESIRKTYYHPEHGRCSFVVFFDYILQMAIYQEIVFQNTGEKLPCYLAPISKEAITDHELIFIDNETLHDRIYGNEFSKGIADDVERIRLLKSGEVEPIKCGACDICVSEKKIERPISWLELGGELN